MIQSSEAPKWLSQSVLPRSKKLVDHLHRLLGLRQPHSLLQRPRLLDPRVLQHRVPHRLLQLLRGRNPVGGHLAECDERALGVPEPAEPGDGDAVGGGVGPAWGGGDWSTDYNSFWCCQGTQIEQNTKLMDSIYFYQDLDGQAEGVMWVHLFVPSTVRWEARGVVVRQNTAFPAGDGTELVVEKAGTKAWKLKVRIPVWAANAEVSVNGEKVQGSVKSGSYVEVGRQWKDGDKVSVKLPKRLRVVSANDKAGVAAVAYGPVILSGNYGNQALSSMPSLALGSVKKKSADGLSLEFTAQANGQTVNLGPFHQAHGHNYNVYWAVSGQLPAN